MEEILLQKLQLSKIKKKIPVLHTDAINKIISYESKKYITCYPDKTIIIRNSTDNTVIRTLAHKESVCDIILLSSGRLASASADKTIKIWNLTNGSCEQTLIGHSDTIYCLELPNQYY